MHRDVTGEHGGRLVFVTIGDPKTFNPLRQRGLLDRHHERAALHRLVQFANGPQKVEPGWPRRGT
jgi:hypothetical protein